MGPSPEVLGPLLAAVEKMSRRAHGCEAKLQADLKADLLSATPIFSQYLCQATLLHTHKISRTVANDK